MGDLAMGVTATGVTTTGIAEWLSGWSPPLENDSPLLVAILRRGRLWLRKAGLPDTSKDLAVLSYLCWRGVGELSHKGRLDDDYLVAGEVLDNYVSDHDAELLCELVPLNPESQVGGMTPEVTAVHTALLLVCGAMREEWEPA